MPKQLIQPFTKMGDRNFDLEVLDDDNFTIKDIDALKTLKEVITKYTQSNNKNDFEKWKKNQQALHAESKYESNRSIGGKSNFTSN